MTRHLLRRGDPVVTKTSPSSKSPSHFLGVGGVAIVAGLLFVLVFGVHLGLLVIFGGLAFVTIVESRRAAKGSNRFGGAARFPLMMAAVGVGAIAASIVELVVWRPMQVTWPLSTAILGMIFTIFGFRGYTYFKEQGSET